MAGQVRCENPGLNSGSAFETVQLECGYSSTRIREEKLIGQSYLQQIRHGELVSWKTLDTICALLDCQPGDLIEYIKE